MGERITIHLPVVTCTKHELSMLMSLWQEYALPLAWSGRPLGRGRSGLAERKLITILDGRCTLTHLGCCVVMAAIKQGSVPPTRVSPHPRTPPLETDMSDYDMDFGYAPAIEQAQIDGSRAIWGARAVVEHSDAGFALAPGRNSWYTEGEPARKALVMALNKGVLDACRAEFVRLRDESWDINRVSQEYVLFEDDAIKVVGNTNGSYGYLYLAAFTKPDDFTGNWVGDWRATAGDKVQVSVNGIGEALVLRGHRIYSVAGLCVMPLRPPEWYLKQNRLGRSGWKHCWVTGTECKHIDNKEVA
jgi:hypothetical protein